MQDPLETDSEGNSLFISDTISSDADIAEQLEHQSDLSRLREVVSKQLFGKERIIIAMRYGLFGNVPHTQQQVARLLGISRSYV